MTEAGLTDLQLVSVNGMSWSAAIGTKPPAS
jgi:hypothetical protein